MNRSLSLNFSGKAEITNTYLLQSLKFLYLLYFIVGFGGTIARFDYIQVSVETFSVSGCYELLILSVVCKASKRK